MMMIGLTVTVGLLDSIRLYNPTVCQFSTSAVTTQQFLGGSWHSHCGVCRN